MRVNHSAIEIKMCTNDPLFSRRSARILQILLCITLPPQNAVARLSKEKLKLFEIQSRGTL